MGATSSVVAVGFCCADVYEELGKFYPTGNGIDWGVHLSRMGLPVSAVSVVGNDDYGSKMRDALSSEGIDVSHLRVENGDTCVMLMALKNGTDRVHLREIEGVMADYALTSEEDAFVKSHDMLHTDLFGNVLDHLEEWHDAGMRIVMDFSTFSRDPEYRCEKYFPYVDYAFMSYDGPIEPVREWIRHVQSLGPKIVVATRGRMALSPLMGRGFTNMASCRARSSIPWGLVTPTSPGSRTVSSRDGTSPTA